MFFFTFETRGIEDEWDGEESGDTLILPSCLGDLVVIPSSPCFFLLVFFPLVDSPFSRSASGSAAAAAVSSSPWYQERREESEEEEELEEEDEGIVLSVL